ncbi:hypothetical protein F5Y01DRAFT_283638 [Xylaria sp. FL0043]|nr:hypothetical protein F5Y01DRAFT_283638 [Xylaria sp. FL0043]
MTPSNGPPESPTDIFEDFDLDEVFQKATPHAENLNSKNFIVEFGPDRARIAFDVESGNIERLLASEKDENYPIRWINIWNPSTQREAVAAIGNHYEFSERLVRLMYMSAQLQPLTTPRKVKERPLLAKHFSRHPDVELGVLGNGVNTPLDSPLSAQFQKGSIELMGPVDDDSMELYLQVKNTVNYFSTDQTQKALCIGAHWLHRRPKGEKGDHEYQAKSMMPPKHWQWLTICNDHTVLSIHEQPSFETPPPNEDAVKWKAEELQNIRANTLDVLLQLSRKGFDLYKRKPLSLNSVRRPLSKWHSRDKPNLDRHETGMTFAIGGEPVSLADEGTSNLFYYLFEDYVAAGPLKTAERKLEHMTSKVLEGARPHIRKKSIDIIPTLHYLSKDLRELKHLFENYKNLINKITALGKTDAQARNGHVEDPRRVMLTDSALSRFDRLGDRLQYLMLNSIEGYLGEISALSSTYFNLTQQKDSEATARLTRSATLLAKLSVFFLPISFLTSYFSVQIEDLYSYWHGTDYWYAFAVIASISFVALFFFSRLLMFFSDTLDEWAIRIAAWFRRLCRAVGFNVAEDEDEYE